LFPLKKDDRVRPKSGHCFVHVHRGDPVKDMLYACRDVCYAYLRLAACEFGGGTDGKGVAQCVARLDGHMLKPTAVFAEQNVRPNGRQALFTSRDGLRGARVRRDGNRYEMEVREHRIQDNDICEPRLVMEDVVDDGYPTAWAESADPEHVAELLAAAVKKVACVSCTHCHYRMEDDDADQR
jgi:hypothetical protein